MQEFLSETELAARLVHAIETVLREQRVRIRALGGTSLTTDTTAAVYRALETASTGAAR